jgi:energy-coupling factor transporter transmembrane protein EcfT
LKITDLDYYAVYGKSWLNKISAKYKVAVVFAVILTVIFTSELYILGGIYIILLGIILFSNLPKMKIIKMSMYPLIFLILFLISLKNYSFETCLMYIFRALGTSTSLIILVFTTSYTKIFNSISLILPKFIVNILFMTYRSLFILVKTLENLLDSLKFRGMPEIKAPLKFFQAVGNLIGFFVIKSIQTGENIYDAMKIRAYSDSFDYMKK